MDDDRGPIWVVVACIVIGAAFMATTRTYFRCHDRGGTLVRGLFWFECIIQPEGR